MTKKVFIASLLLVGFKPEQLPKSSETSEVWQPTLIMSLVRQHADVGQVAVFVVVIKAIADHEGVGNLKTAIIRLHRHLLPAKLSQEHAHPQRRRLQTVEVLDQVAERLPGVEDVIQQQDMPAAHVRR